jgi:hypothetical protein
VLRKLLVALTITVASLFAACGDDRPPSQGTPIGPSPPPPDPSGFIADVQAARDIVRYNQTAAGGSSFRQMTAITRWELPVPVHVDPPVNAEAVAAALDHWAERTGITYGLVPTSDEPCVRVRAGTDGLGGATARALVDGVYANNRARTGLVVVHPDRAACIDFDCRFILRHELGHVLGFFDHTDWPSLMSGGSLDVTAREAAMIRELYLLPHGATVETDGRWRVILPAGQQAATDGFGPTLQLGNALPPDVGHGHPRHRSRPWPTGRVVDRQHIRLAGNLDVLLAEQAGLRHPSAAGALRRRSQ